MRVNGPPRFPNFATLLQRTRGLPAQIMLLSDLRQCQAVRVVNVINQIRPVPMLIVVKRILHAGLG